jgi:hypothetical protein
LTSKRTSLKVTPVPALHVEKGEGEPTVLPLVRDGAPLLVLGSKRVPDLISGPIVPSATTLFGPRGACLVQGNGPLWVSDTGHHRLLGWKALPHSDEAPADFVIGQPDFTCEGRNGREEVGPATVNVPTGICSTGSARKGLAVADAWNHRVLIWHQMPSSSNQPADVVLGQKDFSCAESNRASDTPSAGSMHWPYGVSYDEQTDTLVVCDSGNRRVLIWHGLPTRSGQEADCVLGQADFARRDENAGQAPSSWSMRWPHAATWWQGRLCVADAGNNRVLIWNRVPEHPLIGADIILGQNDERSVDHNKALYWPRHSSLNMPYGITTSGDWLLIADTANSRILGWSSADAGISPPAGGADAGLSGAAGADSAANLSGTASGASALLGQPDFQSKGDNRWQPPCADSLCWPYAAQALEDYLVVCDSGNNRISIWRLAL